MKFTYANDLIILHSAEEWKELKRTVGLDMTTYSAYTSRLEDLKFNHVKRVTAAFYLYNRAAKSELKVYNTNKILLFCPLPRFWSQTGQNIYVPSLSGNIMLKSYLLAFHWIEMRCILALCAKTLRTAPLFGLLSRQVYCVPVWCCAASHSPYRTTALLIRTPCALLLDACILHQRISFRFLHSLS